MGFISRKILPACGNMCVCCPALRPSSQRPVKRYKKLLAEIFPKTLDGPPNERKITKLCEYAAKNPHRIPKIAKFLEQRSYKELRTENINFVKIITEIYNKMLCICKKQMAYFAGSFCNMITELLDNKKQDAVRILACETLTKFIYSQSDNTYARMIENMVRKVCSSACENGEEQKRILRAAGLQCLSAMVWYMTEYSYIFTDFDEIIYAILQNYGIEEHSGDVNQRREPHHNWVDEVVRSEARGVANIHADVSPDVITIMPRPEPKDPSKLRREERETPEVWSCFCIQKVAELAKESTTVRRVLDPMFTYFDNGRHWASRRGLALCVLSDMSSVKSSGSEQMIIAAVIRHLDHKNVTYDPQMKSDIVQTATFLVRQLRSRSGVAELAVVSDLCRHLRKSLQAASESVATQESNWNHALKNFIEDCLLEIAKGISDAYPIFDMMATTLEKLPAVAAVAKAAIESVLVLAHIISVTSVNSLPQMVFPETLLLQLLNIMMHPDVEMRIIAHQIFSVVLVRSATNLCHESTQRKWQSKSTSAFASAAALFEKLRKEKDGISADKVESYANEEISTKYISDEEVKNVTIQKSSPCFHKLSYSVIDRNAVTTPSEVEANIITLSEDQTAQLLSALWLEANLPDNLPSNFVAIAHTFSLTLFSSRFKNSNHCNTARFFQLPLSLMKVSLDPRGSSRPSCQRSLFTVASGMVAFAGKIYQMSDLTETLKVLISSNADPFLRFGDDFQIHIRLNSDIKDFGSDEDQRAAKAVLADFRKIVIESEQRLLDVIIRDLSEITNLGKDELAQQLSETFSPEDGPILGSIPDHRWNKHQALDVSEESLSFDEESSRTSSVNGDINSESTATDLLRFTSRIPTKPPMSPPVISVGQLLESALHVAGQVAGTSVSTSPLPYGAMASQCDALGTGMRKKLSMWLIDGQDSVVDDPLLALPISSHCTVSKVTRCGSVNKGLGQLQALRLPPASPFDNFMRAAGC